MTGVAAAPASVNRRRVGAGRHDPELYGEGVAYRPQARDDAARLDAARHRQVFADAVGAALCRSGPLGAGRVDDDVAGCARLVLEPDGEGVESGLLVVARDVAELVVGAGQRRR